MEITITINGKPVQATVDDAVIREVMSEKTSEKMTGYERNYGKDWRCWTQRPTDEQRKAVKWE